MKKIIIVFFVFGILSCSSDDDAIDRNLLYGQWFRVGLCQTQNNLLLNPDGTFVSFSSGAVDCNDPAPDTYRREGTYTIQGTLYVANTTSTELYIDGTDLSTLDFIDTSNIFTEIVELTDTTMTFSVYSIREDGVREIISESMYEK